MNSEALIHQGKTHLPHVVMPFPTVSFCTKNKSTPNPEVVVDLKSSLNGMVIALIFTIRQIDVATAHEVLKLIPSQRDHAGIGARLVESNATGREARGIVARSLARDVLMMYVASAVDVLRQRRPNRRSFKRLCCFAK